MSLFPTDDVARKMLPVWKMQTRYFPKALREITRVCVANNVRYNPDREPADINWARGKSTDQLGSAYRHMMEAAVDGLVFEAVSEAVTKATGITQVYVLAEASWRLLAALELQIEAVEASSRLTSDPPKPVEPSPAVPPHPVTVPQSSDGLLGVPGLSRPPPPRDGF